MRHLILLLSVCILLCFDASSQTIVSAATRLALHGTPSVKANVRSNGDESVRAFIASDSPQVCEQLRDLGVSVQGRFNGLITASIPLSKLADVCRLASVRQVSVSQAAQVCNDSSRIDSHVQMLADSKGFSMPYTGRGVIVGVIDSGVDFNHINFMDNYGNNRIVAAYLPQDSTGVAPVIQGDTLPGSHYDTPEQIAALTTDECTMSHGTHTTGTAAGSYMANGLQGMAPEAQLVICAMPLLYDTDIANSVRYIFDYAERRGLPAVINMSFASYDGPHDGTSPLCKIFDELSGQGKLLVISAQNSAYTYTHLQHRFWTASDTLSTMIEIFSPNAFNCTASFWSSVSHRHKIALTLIDRTDKKMILEKPFFDELSPDSVLTLDFANDTIWNKYVTGYIQFATAVEEGDRSHSILVNRYRPIDTSRYRLGLKIVTDADPAFHAWVAGNNMFKATLPGQTGGTKAGTINDLATGEKAISVGAYIAKQTYLQATGQYYTTPRSSPLHGMSYFSSWGPDTRGIARPDICAPGMVTISSVSRFDTVSALVNSYNMSVSEHVDGQDYPYGACYGTSMSAPVMTGAAALWLQANPKLSPDDVREILDNTAVRDDFVIDGDARQWGRGKLDAEAGMRYVLRKMNRMDVNGDGAVDVADINAVVNVVLALSDDEQMSSYADVNLDGVVDIIDINGLINFILAIK